MRHYTQQMREWAAAHRARGDGLAATDLECAANHMDRLIEDNEKLRSGLKEMHTDAMTMLCGRGCEFEASVDDYRHIETLIKNQQ